jgi:hypothetical protein
MIPQAAPRFVSDRHALDQLLARIKQMACPRCHRTGMLVGHGLLTGYGERGNDREIRGRRWLCSARFRRMGCGRTSSVLIATVVARFTVRTPAISALLEAIVGGLSPKAAWERTQACAGSAPGLSLRSGYRLWSHLLAAQSRIRTALCALAPPPTTNDARPVAQMLAHLRHTFTGAECLFARFQLALQTGVFA